MSIGDIQMRIAGIQASIGAISARPPTPPARIGTSAVNAEFGVTGPGVSPSVTGSAGVHSASLFATALRDAQGTGTWIKPVNGRVTSEMGPRWGTVHQGIDIAASTGTPVRSMGDGTVVKAGWNNGGYGNFVVIDHGDGVFSRYAHNSTVEVKPGQRVKAGEIISKVGSTGDSTGPHLHLEIQVNGKKVDPRPWMTEHGITL